MTFIVCLSDMPAAGAERLPKKTSLEPAKERPGVTRYCTTTTGWLRCSSIDSLAKAPHSTVRGWVAHFPIDPVRTSCR